MQTAAKPKRDSNKVKTKGATSGESKASAPPTSDERKAKLPANPTSALSIAPSPAPLDPEPPLATIDDENKQALRLAIQHARGNGWGHTKEQIALMLQWLGDGDFTLRFEQQNTQRRERELSKITALVAVRGQLSPPAAKAMRSAAVN